jgi:hypothetical protein
MQRQGTPQNERMDSIVFNRPHDACLLWVMDRRTRREPSSSAALSITDDLLHRNILLLRARAEHPPAVKTA